MHAREKIPGLLDSEGAAEVASSGLFDVHDAPPCGTWVGYFEQAEREPGQAACLLAWMPQVFAPLVDRAIAACRDGSVAWLDDANVPLRHVVANLRIQMLIG